MFFRDGDGEGGRGDGEGGRGDDGRDKGGRCGGEGGRKVGGSDRRSRISDKDANNVATEWRISVSDFLLDNNNNNNNKENNFYGGMGDNEIQVEFPDYLLLPPECHEQKTSPWQQQYQQQHRNQQQQQQQRGNDPLMSSKVASERFEKMLAFNLGVVLYATLTNGKHPFSGGGGGGGGGGDLEEENWKEETKLGILRGRRDQLR